jgi:4-hydroxybenzoate polyprenyltransferase
MGKLKLISGIVRFPNLIMIILVQYVMYHLLGLGIEYTWLFVSVAMATILIAAGGYALNNACDIEIDKINHPEKFTQYYPSNSFLYSISFFLMAAGIGLGYYNSVVLGMYLFPIYLSAALMLVLYAFALSKYKIIGNVVVSILVALAPLLMFFSFYGLYTYDPNLLLVSLVLLYAFFAFLLNWIREIVKDLEDMDGDKKHGRKTVPLLLGIAVAKTFVFLLFSIFVLIFSLILIEFNYFVILAFLALISLVFYIMLLKAAVRNDFRILSIFIKVIMFLGLISPLFI